MTTETTMTAITKFFSREEGFLARSWAVVRRESQVALRQHLEICQILAEALAHGVKR